MNRICVVCGRSFDAKTTRAKYCCDKCKNHSRYDTRESDILSKAALKSKKYVELYNSGVNVKEIAAMFGMKSCSQIYKALNKAGVSRQLTQIQRDVKELREKGLCCTEIAEITGKRTSTINQVVKAIDMPFTEEEKQRSIALGNIKGKETQYGDLETRIERQRSFFSENFPNWEYVSGFISSDDEMEMQCKTCKTIIKRSAITVRKLKSSIACPICQEREREKREAEEAKEREEEQRRIEKQRIKRFWEQDFEQAEFNIKTCKQCGALYIGGRSIYCSDECRQKSINRKHDRRLMRAKRIDRSITLEKLFMRDRGICWLCGGKCDYGDHSYDERGNYIVGENYPSIDHVYPLSKGGNHIWSNVKLAHHHCNTLKSDKVVAYA